MTVTTDEHAFDGYLYPWAEIEDVFGDAGLLVGNGASQVVWTEFGYNSLYQEASSPSLTNPLTTEDKALFRALGDTKNFEAVLRDLRIAAIVEGSWGKMPNDHLLERYDNIKNALVQTVHRVHVEWNPVNSVVLPKLRQAISAYESIYSTNYDFLLYWAIMREPDQGDNKYHRTIVDYFRGGKPFKVGEMKRYSGESRILYLHGALHLYYIPYGDTFKTVNDGANLLSQFGAYPHPDAVPLFVTEGTADQKMEAIRRSDYLSFAYQEFRSHDAPLVVFGQGLSDYDAHIRDVVAGLKKYPIAVSLRAKTADGPRDEDEIQAEKLAMRSHLRHPRLLFYDAATHPLGDPALAIKPVP